MRPYKITVGLQYSKHAKSTCTSICFYTRFHVAINTIEKPFTKINTASLSKNAPIANIGRFFFDLFDSYNIRPLLRNLDRFRAPRW